jgi:hypothetical protein
MSLLASLGSVASTNSRVVRAKNQGKSALIVERNVTVLIILLAQASRNIENCDRPESVP